MLYEEFLVPLLPLQPSVGQTPENKTPLHKGQFSASCRTNSPAVLRNFDVVTHELSSYFGLELVPQGKQNLEGRRNATPKRASFNNPNSISSSLRLLDPSLIEHSMSVPLGCAISNFKSSSNRASFHNRWIMSCNFGDECWESRPSPSNAAMSWDRDMEDRVRTNDALEHAIKQSDQWKTN